MKDSASGKIPANGLSEKEKDNSSPADLGLDSHGPNQMPMGIKKQKVSTPSGSFNFR
jgi:hypothetical protein|tara:strand:+ start:919 stop:1089 length:171 start_codon:yes stop_codon:yes gene_type:complete